MYVHINIYVERHGPRVATSLFFINRADMALVCLFVCLFRDSNAKSGTTAPNQEYNTTLSRITQKFVKGFHLIKHWMNTTMETPRPRSEITR